MRAVQEGKLFLDEDINSYLLFKVINPHYPNEKIKLRNLATHTSGITDRSSVYEDTNHFGGGARALAKHVGAPTPTTENPIHVPLMTAWLLDEFEEDDEVFGLFCAALHSNRHYVGGMARYFVGTEERVSPYLKHPLRRIREWAQNEIDHAKFMIEWDRQLEGERDRT